MNALIEVFAFTTALLIVCGFVFSLAKVSAAKKEMDK